jgi:hypothetical protein
VVFKRIINKPPKTPLVVFNDEPRRRADPYPFNPSTNRVMFDGPRVWDGQMAYGGGRHVVRSYDAYS